MKFSAIASVTGGILPYIYQWNNGDSTDALQGVSAGTYAVTVTDSYGCVAFESITVPEYANVCILTTLGTSGLPASCIAVCDGIATVTALPMGEQYTYLWNDLLTQTNSIANDLCAGTYTVIVTDSIGCSDTASVTVSSQAEIILSVNATDATCGNTDGSASVNVTNGAAPYTYSWSSGDTLSLADSLMSGIYVATVNDANGCSSFGIATISDANGPVISNMFSTEITCNGGSDGAISIIVGGGTQPYTYLWSNGGNATGISNLVAGPYEVNVTDSAGCIANTSITVNEPSSIDITIAATDAVCSSSDGNATASVSGGTSPYTYLWSTGETGASIAGVTAGIYSLVITDANGCIDSSTAAISNIGGATVTIDSIIGGGCGAEPGSIFISVSGGAFPYTFTWSDSSTIEDLIDVSAGSYSVLVTDTNGCISTASAIISGIPASEQEICLVTVDSATGRNLVVWEKAQTQGVQSYNIYRESTQAGTYYSIGNVPVDNLSLFVDTLSNPHQQAYRYKISVVDSCGNESGKSQEHKTIHLTINKGLGNDINLIWDHYEGFVFYTYYIYRYSTSTGWLVIDSIASNLTSRTDPSPPPANLWYQIVVKHPSVCSATLKSKNYNSSKSNTTSISLSETLTANATATDADQGTCNGTATVTAIGGAEPYTYQWNDPNNQTTITATGLCGNTTYTVLVTDDDGDTTSANVFVDEASGINKFQVSGFKFRVYPNPNKGIFNLDIEGTSEIVEIRVVNILGQEIYQSAIINPSRHEVGISASLRQSGLSAGALAKVEIDLSGHPSGIYNLLIITHEGLENVRIIIE